MIIAFIFALLYSIAIPLETLVVPLIVNDLFGSVSYDKLLGIIVALNYTGYALGGPIVNLCYDKFGTYSPALFVLAISTVLMLIIFQGVINSANKVKKSIIEKQEQEA
jgi:MFS family permease